MSATVPVIRNAGALPCSRTTTRTPSSASTSLRSLSTSRWCPVVPVLPERHPVPALIDPGPLHTRDRLLHLRRRGPGQHVRTTLASFSPGARRSACSTSGRGLRPAAVHPAGRGRDLQHRSRHASAGVELRLRVGQRVERYGPHAPPVTVCQTKPPAPFLRHIWGITPAARHIASWPSSHGSPTATRICWRTPQPAPSSVPSTVSTSLRAFSGSLVKPVATIGELDSRG